jgi:molecular chaperone Hsp33
MFVGTVEDIELLDAKLPPEELLWRLFHQDAVRVHAPECLAFHCGCDAARIGNVLRNYPAEQLRTLADADGIVRARCEFCGATHSFGADDLPPPA